MNVCYVITKRAENGELEFLNEESGDDCFTDDLGLALRYEDKNSLPTLQSGEIISVVIEDEDGHLTVQEGDSE